MALLVHLVSACHVFLSSGDQRVQDLFEQVVLMLCWIAVELCP